LTGSAVTCSKLFVSPIVPLSVLRAAVGPELTSIVSLMDATLNVACTLRAWRASSRTSASVKSENPAFLATIR